VNLAIVIGVCAWAGSFLGGVVGNLLRPSIREADAERIASRAVDKHTASCPAAALTTREVTT
jgi:hypothetical protein